MVAITEAAGGVVVDPEGLKRFCSEALESTGISPDDAKRSAEVLVRTDLRGVESHGVWFFYGYIHQALQGGVNVKAQPRDIIDTGPISVIDGDAGIGLAVAHRATERAIERASRHGLGLVLVRNSNHLGAAGHYALMCAEAGKIGLVMTNTPPVMAVTGSRARVLGNGPLAFAAPVERRHPIALDIAMSLVAGGKIRMALQRGEKVPLGWLVGPNGVPTTEPEDYLNGGALVPMGDHKGYGLALMVEILAGVLAGAGMASEITSWLWHPETQSNTGHFILCLDIAAVMPEDEFARRITKLSDEITGAAKAEGVERIILPGDIEAECEQRARAEGLNLRTEAWTALTTVADELSMRDRLEAIRIG